MKVDNEVRNILRSKHSRPSHLPYPENPIIKQYSAEYWILGDLWMPEELRGDSFARRVLEFKAADVIFVPFFATLSAELQLIVKKSVFRERVEDNEDFKRQKMIVDLVRNSEAWERIRWQRSRVCCHGEILMQ